MAASSHKRERRSPTSSKKNSSLVGSNDLPSSAPTKSNNNLNDDSDSSTMATEQTEKSTATTTAPAAANGGRASMKKTNSFRRLLKRVDSVQILQGKKSSSSSKKSSSSSSSKKSSSSSKKKKNSLVVTASSGSKSEEMTADESVKAEVQKSSSSSKKGSNKKMDMRSLLKRADSINIFKSGSGASSNKASSSSSSKNKKKKMVGVEDEEDKAPPPPPPPAPADAEDSLSDLEESLSETLSPRSPSKKKLSAQSLLNRADSISLLSTAKLDVGDDDDSSSSEEGDGDKSSKKKKSKSKRRSSIGENDDDDDESLQLEAMAAPNPWALEAAQQDSTVNPWAAAEEDAADESGRKVKFNLRGNTVYESHVGPEVDLDEENDERWYRREDYAGFRGATTLGVKRISESEDRTDKCYKRVISSVYLSCCKASSSGAEKMKLSPQAEQSLNICLNKWGKRLGLELMAVPGVQNDNFTRRQKLVRIINNIQRELNMYHCSYEERSEAIREGLIKASRPCALFAQCIGAALSEAVVADTLENPESVTPEFLFKEDSANEFEPEAPVEPEVISQMEEMIEEAPTSPTPASEEEDAPAEETKEDEPSAASAGAPQKRRVSFENENSTIVIGVAVNADATKDCWYNLKENQKFREYASAEVEELAMSTSDVDCRYKGTLNGLYLACCRAGKDKENTLSTEISKDENPSIFSRKAKLDLMDCLSESAHRRGLEMIYLQCSGEDIRHRRHHQKRVFDIQKNLKDLSVESRAKMIRQGVEPVSRPSRLFAREMATTLRT